MRTVAALIFAVACTPVWATTREEALERRVDAIEVGYEAVVAGSSTAGTWAEEQLGIMEVAYTNFIAAHPQGDPTVTAAMNVCYDLMGDAAQDQAIADWNFGMGETRFMEGDQLAQIDDWDGAYSKYDAALNYYGGARDYWNYAADHYSDAGYAAQVAVLIMSP